MRSCRAAVDVKSAFLQADDLDRNVYVRPPSDVRKSDVIWLLKKPLYGLPESSRRWHITINNELIERGLQVSIYDKSQFILRVKDKLYGVLCLHVDDIMFGGRNEMQIITKDI